MEAAPHMARWEAVTFRRTARGRRRVRSLAAARLRETKNALARSATSAMARGIRTHPTCTLETMNGSDMRTETIRASTWIIPLRMDVLQAASDRGTSGIWAAAVQTDSGSTAGILASFQVT